MYQYGHWGAALLAYAPVGLVVAVGSPELAIGGAVVTAALSMLPDQDQGVPFLNHRGLTHTVHFAALTAFGVGVAGGAVGASTGTGSAVLFGLFGAVIGGVAIGSHIAADALTPAGVDPFRSGETITYDVVTAANPIGNAVLLLFGAVAAALAVGAGVATRNAVF